MNSNLAAGAQFEREFCQLLYNNGFWVHRIVQNIGGQQPADIIAIKGRFHALIDCKVVSTIRGFSFERVEDNQRMAMSLFKLRGIEEGWFALKLPSGKVEMLNLWQIEKHESNNRHSINTAELESGKFTVTLDEWMRRAASMWK
jgi:Holliday junction resolvase